MHHSRRMGGGTDTISWNLGLGCVYSLNLEFPVCESADRALAHFSGWNVGTKMTIFGHLLINKCWVLASREVTV